MAALLDDTKTTHLSATTMDCEHADTGINVSAANEQPRDIHGLLVAYRDDEIDTCVHAALHGKKRVHYKCMDVFANFVAFGTSVGAVYLFRLTTITHAACKLVLVIPCDQGSVEVLRFLPGQVNSNELLVAIGTSRGSLVIFQLSCLDEQTVRARELYRAEEFTKSAQESAVRIKLIEYDQDYLLDPYNLNGPGTIGNNNSTSKASPQCSFSKLYICDQAERIFVLESSSIYPAFRLLYSHKPAHVLSVDESSVNQICVHRSQLLMSTNERTRLFSELSNELVTIGKRQRKSKGFFGACFFNPNYRPARMLSARSRQALGSSQPSVCSSTNSLLELENVLIFVARPKFSLWQVNNRREVMLTHIFDSSIRGARASPLIRLDNAALERLDQDDHEALERALRITRDAKEGAPPELQSDHFEKLVPIFSTTLGNLLLSYTRREIFVVDPIGARLIAWHQHDKPIVQVCCNENEIFILSEPSRRQFHVDRLILLAPTQFILELHRTNRFLSLMVFMQTFSEQLRQLMALPLSGPGTITTEGGLLRNIVWNTWRECTSDPRDDRSRVSSASTSSSSSRSSNATLDGEQEGESERNGRGRRRRRFDGKKFARFKMMVDQILEESRHLKQSFENLADSQLLFTMSNENIERLCSEPYASMVSLDISIANLHTNHVVHFSQEALQRHKSIAKLSQSIMNLSKLKRASTQASLLTDSDLRDRLANSNLDLANRAEQATINFDDKRVVVEQLRPKQRVQLQPPMQIQDKLETRNVFNVIREIQESQALGSLEFPPPALKSHSPDAAAEGRHLAEPYTATQNDDAEEAAGLEEEEEEEDEGPPATSQIEAVDKTRCPHCQWPRARAHLKPMHHSQQIQYTWIQENLLPNVQENLDQIEERAFKHGLWNLILRCYAARSRWDDYIMCCIMLDDVRLLNIERFVSSASVIEDGEIIERAFSQLRLKLDLIEEVEGTRGDNDQLACKSCCFKCKQALPCNSDSELDEDRYIENSYSQLAAHTEDDISFNLVNMFRKFMLRKSGDVKAAVGQLLQHSDLLNRCKIPADFYLQAVANQCAVIRRTRLKT